MSKENLINNTVAGVGLAVTTATTAYSEHLQHVGLLDFTDCVKQFNTVLHNPELSFRLASVLLGWGGDLALPLVCFFSVYLITKMFERVSNGGLGLAPQESDRQVTLAAASLSIIVSLFYFGVELTTIGTAPNPDADKLSGGDKFDILAFSVPLIATFIWMLSQLARRRAHR